MVIRCLVVDEMHSSITSLLNGINVECDYRPEITRSEIKEIIDNYEGLIIRSKTKVDADLIEDSKLLFIARAGAGIDNMDEEVLKAKDIKVLNAPSNTFSL